MPALTHGGTVITENAAICAYLADAFPKAGLAPPPGDRARAPYYRWFFYAAGPLEAAVTNKMLGFAVPEDRKRMAGYGSYDDVMNTLDALLSKQEYLAGNRFSAADLYLGSHLGFGMQFGAVEKRPAFERYWERLSQRPAAIRARDIDDALIPKKD